MGRIITRDRVRKALGLLVACSPLALLVVVLSLPASVLAGSTVVTDCSTEAALDTALASFDHISFNCSNTHAPATIHLSSAKSPLDGTTLDGSNGGHTIILDGQGATRLFQVGPGRQVTLTHLILTHGAAINGSCLFANGSLRMVDVEVHNCQAGPGQDGGALYVNSGASATLIDANLHDNSAGVSGGAIYSLGALTVTDSAIRINQANAADGGGIWAASDTHVSGSSFGGNTTTGGWGGAIYNQGTLTVTSSTLGGNATGQGGGGIHTFAGSTALFNVTLGGNHATFGGGLSASHASLAISNTLLSDNVASTSGGGIYDDSSNVDLEGSLVSGNSAGLGGGGLFIGDFAIALVYRSTLSGNSAGTGGGVENTQSALTQIVSSTVSSNSADLGGGVENSNEGDLEVASSTISGNSATDGGGVYNNSNRNNLTSLSDSTFSGNTATEFGGGLENFYQATLFDVTFSDNRAASGGAEYNVGAARLVVTDTVLAYSPTGGNCAGTALFASKSSLSSDMTCALSGTVHGKNPNGLDPLLTALGNFGGPTLVHMLKHNSPAIDGVVGSEAAAVDQRGEPRPALGGYDIGAVERQPGDSDRLPWLWLPLTRR